MRWWWIATICCALRAVEGVPCTDDATQHCPACEFKDGHLLIHAHSLMDFNFHCAMDKATGQCGCRSHANGAKSLELHGHVVQLSLGSLDATSTASSDETDAETAIDGLGRDDFDMSAQLAFREALAPALHISAAQLLIVGVKSTMSSAVSASVLRRRRLLPQEGGIVVRWKFLQSTDVYGAGRERVSDVTEVAEELALPNSPAVVAIAAEFRSKMCETAQYESRCRFLAARGFTCCTFTDTLVSDGDGPERGNATYCELAALVSTAGRRSPIFKHLQQAQDVCKKAPVVAGCFWQYDQFRRRQYSHRFESHECTNGLPRGNCVVSLRSAQVAHEDQDWEAFGPGEESKSMSSYAVWDGDWAAGEAGFRFTNWDKAVNNVHVDYMCNADGLAKLPGQYTCHYRNTKGHAGNGVLEHRFSAKECERPDADSGIGWMVWHDKTWVAAPELQMRFVQLAFVSGNPVSDLALEQAAEIQKRQMVGFPAYFTNFLHFKAQRMVVWNGDGSHVTTLKALDSGSMHLVSHKNVDDVKPVCVTRIPAADRANEVLMKRTFDPLQDPRYDHVLPKQAVYEGREMSLFSVRFVERDCTNGVPAGNCVVGIRKAFGKAGWDYNWKAFGPNEQTYPGGPKGAGMSWMSHLLPSDLKSGSSFLVEVAASYVCDKAG
eukprot:g1630.t1